MALLPNTSSKSPPLDSSAERSLLLLPRASTRDHRPSRPKEAARFCDQRRSNQSPTVCLFEAHSNNTYWIIRYRPAPRAFPSSHFHFLSSRCHTASPVDKSSTGCVNVPTPWPENCRPAIYPDSRVVSKRELDLIGTSSSSSSDNLASRSSVISHDRTPLAWVVFDFPTTNTRNWRSSLWQK